MSDPNPDDDPRTRDQVVGNSQAPLPEPWFIREARERRGARPVDPAPAAEMPYAPRFEAVNPAAAPALPAARPWRTAAIVAVSLIVAMLVWLALLPKQGGAPPVAEFAENGATAAIEESPATGAAVPDVAPSQDVEPSPVADQSLAASEAPPLAPAAQPRDEPVEPGFAAGPSFDCDRVTSRVLEAVCASPRLAALDAEMAALFFELRDASDPATRGDLEDSRAEFIAERQSCPDERCIARAYRDRIDELESYR